MKRSDWVATGIVGFVILCFYAVGFYPLTFRSGSRRPPPQVQAAQKIRQEAMKMWEEKHDLPVVLHKLRMAAALDPRSPFSRQAIADVLYEAGKRDLAFAEYRASVRRFGIPLFDDARYRYAVLCEEHGMIDEAYKAYEKVVRENGGQARRDWDGRPDHEVMAFIHLLMGQRHGAPRNRDFYLQAYQDCPHEPYLLYRLANGLAQVGENEKALDIYRRSRDYARDPGLKKAAQDGMDKLTLLAAMKVSPSPSSQR